MQEKEIQQLRSKEYYPIELEKEVKLSIVNNKTLSTRKRNTGNFNRSTNSH